MGMPVQIMDLKVISVDLLVPFIYLTVQYSTMSIHASGCCKQMKIFKEILPYWPKNPIAKYFIMQ